MVVEVRVSEAIPRENEDTGLYGGLGWGGNGGVEVRS